MLYFTIAYLSIWFFLFIYIYRLIREQNNLRNELDLMRELIHETKEKTDTMNNVKDNIAH